MLDLSAQPSSVNASVFLVGAAIVAWRGTKLAGIADRLADRTGLGEAITGTVFLGWSTSLPGLTASITAALDGHPALAIANAIGGIAIQTSFLAVADVAHRKANLEHAAASLVNMVQTAVLVALLALVLLGLTGPEITVGHVHPITGFIVVAAGAGFWLVVRSRRDPMWRPTLTRATIEDVPEEEHTRADLGRMLGGFVVNALVVIAAGAAIAHTAGNIAEGTGLSEVLAGALLSGVATSLPELVTTVAAVRRGALTLAVSDIVGGNFFDVLFVVASDLVYLRGSIYTAPGVGDREAFLTGLAVTLNVVLLVGLLARQRAGPANIGFEGWLILLLYAAGLAALVLM